MYRPHLDFALALHHRLPAGGNLPWSPYSVSSALGLAAAGARGRTRDELVTALVPGGDLAALGRLLVEAATPAEAEAAVANTLWMRTGWRVLPDYATQLAGWPGGRVRDADFAGDPEGVRVRINEDVADTTRGLVRDLLAPGAVHREIAAVIVNALYLKVAWLSPFPEHATAPASFATPSGPREVPMMHQQESFPYAAAAGWRMVSLPTPGDAVVDVLLPDDPAPEALSRMSTDVLTALYGALSPVKLDLALPRFRVEASAQLATRLAALGVRAPFDREAADFSGLTDTERLWVEQVVHKTVLRVDEQGFEGAAATAVMMRAVSMDLSAPLPFYVDRPFLLVVRHRGTGALYFLARIVDPAA